MSDPSRPPASPPAQATTSITDIATALREDARVLFQMPAGEQFIGARDAVLYAALNRIADALEQIQ